MNRRSLLLGIGAALAAPSIVRAENLMKLWVPKREPIQTSVVKFGGQVYWIASDGFYTFDDHEQRIRRLSFA